MHAIDPKRKGFRNRSAVFDYFCFLIYVLHASHSKPQYGHCGYMISQCVLFNYSFLYHCSVRVGLGWLGGIKLALIVGLYLFADLLFFITFSKLSGFPCILCKMIRIMCEVWHLQRSNLCLITFTIRNEEESKHCKSSGIYEYTSQNKI